MAALERVGIVGLGVIGGSLARALRAAGVPLLAWSASASDCAAAAEAGIATASSLAALAASDVVVIAVPPSDIGAVARELLSHVRSDAMLFHTGGLQRTEAIALGPHERARVLGTHPIAGSHASGFAAARSDLFRGASVSIESRASDHDRECAERLWRAAGVTSVVYRDAEAHDRLMAWVSHLPQIVSTALAAAMADGHVAPGETGAGARDATRLAQSPWPMWHALLTAAPNELIGALSAMESRLRAARIAIEHGEAERLGEMWERGKSWRTRAEDES